MIKKNFTDCQFLFHRPTKLFTYLGAFLNYITYITQLNFEWIQTSLESSWQRAIHLSDFFQNPLVLIPKWKPGPPTFDQSVYHAGTRFREKGGIFSMGSANLRNQENGVIFQTRVREILQKG